VVAVFQPHLYSRTRALSGGFARALSAADQVFLTEIYPSREAPLPGVDAGLIVRAMQENGYRSVRLAPEKDQLPDLLCEACRPGDLVIMLGAGDIDTVAATLLERLRERAG
jgi:UDP-N-acetylmuramate--alanine ligase